MSGSCLPSEGIPEAAPPALTALRSGGRSTGDSPTSPRVLAGAESRRFARPHRRRAHGTDPVRRHARLRSGLAKREMIPTARAPHWAEQVLAERSRSAKGITGWAVEHRDPCSQTRRISNPRVRIVPGTPAEPEAASSSCPHRARQPKGTLNIYRERKTPAHGRGSSGSPPDSATPPRSRGQRSYPCRASSTRRRQTLSPACSTTGPFTSSAQGVLRASSTKTPSRS